MGRRWTVAFAGLLLFAFACPIRARAADDDKIAPLQAQFDKELDPVHKARLLAKLGDAQIAAAHRAERDNDFSTAGLLMEKYRDNVRVSLAALLKKFPDAEKHDLGYRILEIHVRQSLGDLDETVRTAPPPYRPPFDLVRQDLNGMREQLLRALFPRRPGERPLPSPANAPPVKPAAPPEIKPDANPAAPAAPD